MKTFHQNSLLHLMRAIACAHATSLMHVKNSMLFDTYCLGHWNEEN